MLSKDPIKRRLDLLDEHFKERESLMASFLERSPLVFAACGIICGIALANMIANFPVWVPLVLLAVNTTVCVFLLKKKLPHRRIGMLAFLTFSSFLFLGSIRLCVFNDPPVSDISNFVTQDRQMATLRGTVITDIRQEDRGSWKFGAFLPLSPSSSFYLDLEQIKTKTSWADITGKVRVNISATLTGISAGDRVEIYCTLSKFPNASNPGQFEMARYMKRKSVLYGAAIYSPGGVKVMEKGAAALTKLRYKLKTVANSALFSDTQIESDNAGLLAALLLGTRGQIDTSTYEAFRRTGLSHFISLSGMHMAILASILWWSCRYTGLSKPYRAAICIALIVLYVLTIPPRPPSLRAAIICCFFFFSMIVRRKPNPLNTLSLAAIILLLGQPASLFQAGWQLSFSCVAGIILFYKSIEHYIISKTIDRIAFFSREHEKAGAIFIQSFSIKTIGLLSAGLSAWIGGSGVMLYHFSTITPLACVWTVTVYGFIMLILPIGYFKILLAAVLPTVSMVLAFALDILSEWLIGVVGFIAEYDFSQIVIGKVPLIVIAAFYLNIVLLRFWHTDRRVLRKAVLYGLAISVAVSLMVIKIAPHRRNTLELTCLDVGHGQAIVAFFPDGSNILFDAGSLSAKNSGASIVVPFLQTKGISKLDAIIASHEDIDHINGIPEVVGRYRSARVYGNSALLGQVELPTKIRHLNNALLEVSSGLKPVEEYPNKYITALWPTEEICNDPAISTNNKSQVSLIEYAGKKILICSDIEIFAQSKIFEMYPDLTADIIVMPHHGSKTNLLENYAEKLGAKIAIVSCAKRRLQSNWKAPGEIEAYYTPIDGAITIRIKKDGTIKITTHK
ncbi:MAG: DNA internalization-related competence protein ComEC/Rec2 [Planctomycetes bacterium]|nr:DNA internalization-related competence protein ComEC/Rec2 [Planctomycetota bacterium]